MSTVKKFGPYKGSEANGGRPIYVYKKKVGDKWVTTSKNKARADYESEHGKIKSKNTTVDHKDNNHIISKNKANNIANLLAFGIKIAAMTQRIV